MDNEVISILASNIANQAITIAKLQAENNQLKKLLVKANDELEEKGVKDNEHTNINAHNGQK